MGGKTRGERKAAQRRRRRGEPADEAERRALAGYLSARGLQMLEIAEDGNCLFRSFARQIYGVDDVSHYSAVRDRCADALVANREEYELFLDEDGDGPFDTYVADLRKDGTWGGQLEILALCRTYKVGVMLFQRDQRGGAETATPSAADKNRRRKNKAGNEAADLATEFRFHYYDIECPVLLDEVDDGDEIDAATEQSTTITVAGKSSPPQTDRQQHENEKLLEKEGDCAQGSAAESEDKAPASVRRRGRRAEKNSERAAVSEKQAQHMRNARRRCRGKCILLAYVGGDHYNVVRLDPTEGTSTSILDDGAALPTLEAVKQLLHDSALALNQARNGDKNGKQAFKNGTGDTKGISLSAHGPDDSKHGTANSGLTGDSGFVDFVTQLEECLPDGPSKRTLLYDQNRLRRHFTDHKDDVDDAVETMLEQFLACDLNGTDT
ncbi:unnamed protein product [Amoebophrya sp. A25]|nr:unnamed protein product [Amoebophrya sp. A25]|eukprot:GSA25T00023666001.1